MKTSQGRKKGSTNEQKIKFDKQKIQKQILPRREMENT